MKKAPLGADLVIPLLALAFAAYFFVSISDLAWEAKANGVIIGTALVLLIAVQLVRIAIEIAKGRGDFSTAPRWQPREVLMKRVGMVAVLVAFIATIKWLGLTLGLFIGMAVSLWILGVRKPARVAAISFVVAASAYLLFILALNSDFPHGPIEHAIAALRS